MLPIEDCKIVVLPGILGSTLKDVRGGQGTLWGYPDHPRKGSQFKRLRLAEDGTADMDETVRVFADGLIPSLYGPLIDSLEHSMLGIVEVFPFDWRKPVEEAAFNLGSSLKGFLSGSADRSIVIVAHSLGGLIAAQAIATLGPLLRQIKGIVAFGVPWLGSYEVALALRGEGTVLQLIAELTGLGHSATLDILQTFWGWTDLLPLESSILSRSFFANGPIAVSRAGALQLRSPNTIPRYVHIPVLPIVGKERSTPIAIHENASELAPVMGEGDGIVPLVSATAIGTLAPVFVPASHFRLMLDREGIKGAVLQVGKWLQSPAYLLPDSLAPSAPDCESGTIHRLKARLSRRFAPATRRTLCVADFWTLLGEV